MDYFFEAFGRFDPQNDPDVAVKFVLNNILMDNRMAELAYLLTDGHEIGGIEGEPGWFVERRDDGSAAAISEDANWPAGTNFHIYVDEDAFTLGFPEQYLKTDQFHDYVRQAMSAYLKNSSVTDPAISLVLSKLAP